MIPPHATVELTLVYFIDDAVSLQVLSNLFLIECYQRAFAHGLLQGKWGRNVSHSD